MNDLARNVMKAVYRPTIVLLVLWVLYCGYVVQSSESLPAQVATHFGADGTPNGWMSRSSHVRFMIGFGVGIPLLLMLLSGLAGILPRGYINIPHRDYWFTSEREPATREFVSRHLAWLSCVIVGFLGGLHYSIVDANRRDAARLSSSILWTLVGSFLVLIVLWVLRLMSRFRSRSFHAE